MSRPAFGLLIALILAAAACKDDGMVTVRSLGFRGVRAVDVDRLRAALATRVSSRIPWGRQVAFDRSRFEADLKRLEAFYADRGFPDAHVASFDVKLNQNQDEVDLTVTIGEGRPVTVAAIELEGFDVLPPGRLQSLRNEISLRIGEPRDRQRVSASHDVALNELREHGYAYAKVETVEGEGAASKEVTITFRADPGVLAQFGPIEIAGNSSVSPHVIERQLTYRPGDLYRRSVVQNSQRRLYGMELFQFVNIQTLNPEKEEPEIRTRVTVAEGNHQRVNFGVGYGTEEKARADGQYHHVNFLGGARAAGVHARWSSLDRGIRFDFNQPYFFNPTMALSADAQRWLTVVPAYQSAVAGAKVTLTRRPSPQTWWSVSMTSERNETRLRERVQNFPSLIQALIALGIDPTTGRQEGTLNAIGFDYQRSTADSLLNATRGYQVAVHAEEAGRVIPGTFDYYALSGDVRHYLPISRNVVWANRVQLGGIWPISDQPANVPFGKKYFLGGATSIRGWGRFEVSPLSEGVPIGGNALVAFSSEIRTPLAGQLGGVLFLDGGNVWPDVADMTFDELRYSAGLGVRYGTPIGPIRFDLGYQLNPFDGLRINGQPESRHWRLHFSIGQAF